jgi:hypothetical protein
MNDSELAALAADGARWRAWMATPYNAEQGTRGSSWQAPATVPCASCWQAGQGYRAVDVREAVVVSWDVMGEPREFALVCRDCADVGEWAVWRPATGEIINSANGGPLRFDSEVAAAEWVRLTMSGDIAPVRASALAAEVSDVFTQRGDAVHLCPFCGSDDLTGDSWEQVGPTVSQVVDCVACGEVWTDSYQLASSERVERGRVWS